MGVRRELLEEELHSELSVQRETRLNDRFLTHFLPYTNMFANSAFGDLNDVFIEAGLIKYDVLGVRLKVECRTATYEYRHLYHLMNV